MESEGKKDSESVSEAETTVAQIFGSFESEVTALQNSILLPFSLPPESAREIRLVTVELGQCHTLTAALPACINVLEERLLTQLATVHHNSDMHAAAFEGIKLYYNEQIAKVQATKFNVDARVSSLKRLHASFYMRVRTAKTNADKKQKKLLDGDAAVAGELGRC